VHPAAVRADAPADLDQGPVAEKILVEEDLVVAGLLGVDPVESMAQRRELLLDALGLVGLRLDLDPGRDVQRLDVEEILDPGLGFGPNASRSMSPSEISTATSSIT